MKFCRLAARVCAALLPALAGIVTVFAVSAAYAQTAGEYNYRYGNLFDLAPGLSYMNTPVGPHVSDRAQLPGLDFSATEWIFPRWGAMGEFRGYSGPASAIPNKYGVNSPLVTDLQLAGGAQYRWVRNQSLGINLHALAGGAYGIFDTHIPAGVSGPDVGLYPNGGSVVLLAGPDFDFHRNSFYSIRVSPGYTLTHFGGETQSNFSISASLVLHYGRF